jgi:2-polyprenyl-3-methyl-5-hydroxy-6-metoxy-1,4-benzoquinol methylase
LQGGVAVYAAHASVRIDAEIGKKGRFRRKTKQQIFLHNTAQDFVMTGSEYFDAKAREWDEHPGKRKVAQVFVAELQKNVSLHPAMDLFEFGCGTGLVSMEFHRQVANITLLDTSPGMIEVLQEKILQQGIVNMYPRLGELSEIDQVENHFDLIYSNMALHHVTNVEQTLAKLVHLLKPCGVLCIGDLETEDGSFHQNETQTHHGFDCQQLASTLVQLGLDIEHCYRSHTVQKTDAEGRTQNYPLFFLQACRPAL